MDQVKDNNREVVTLFRITSSSITNIAFNSRNNLYKWLQNLKEFYLRNLTQLNVKSLLHYGYLLISFVFFLGSNLPRSLVELSPKTKKIARFTFKTSSQLYHLISNQSNSHHTHLLLLNQRYFICSVFFLFILCF